MFFDKYAKNNKPVRVSQRALATSKECLPNAV